MYIMVLYFINTNTAGNCSFFDFSIYIFLKILS